MEKCWIEINFDVIWSTFFLRRKFFFHIFPPRKLTPEHFHELDSAQFLLKWHYWLKCVFFSRFFRRYKDANPVDPSSTVGIFNDGTELRISTIRHEDIGDYTCIARNGEGQVSHTARVIIAGGAVIMVKQTITFFWHCNQTVYVCLWFVFIYENPSVPFKEWNVHTLLLPD